MGPVSGRVLVDCTVGCASIIFVALRRRSWKGVSEEWREIFLTDSRLWPCIPLLTQCPAGKQMVETFMWSWKDMNVLGTAKYK